MASLLDNLRKNSQTFKQGSGPLEETSEEELQNLAQKAGMPTTPSSPLSSQGIGANPDQAKMVGTPAQNTASLRMSLQGQNNLSDYQRTQQSRQQASAEEQQTEIRSKAFEGLGSLGTRVQELSTRMFNQASSPQNLTGKAIQANEASVDQYLAKGADKTQTMDLLNKLGSDSISDQEMTTLANSLGFTDVSDLTALKSTVKNQFLSQEEQVGAFTASHIADQINVKDFTPEQVQSLGFDNMQAMADALQIPVEQLQLLSLKDLQDTVGKEQLADFGKVQKAQATIADPSASRAEKENALSILKELGSTGVRAAESDVKKINQQVANADTVKFGGQSYQVDTLLKDDTIKGMVKSYLTDPDTAKTLKDKEPQFAQWIEDNKKILSAAASDVDARQESYAKVQLDNMKIAETPAGNLNEAAMKSFVPNYGKLTGEKIQPPAFVTMLNNKELSPGDASNLVSTVNELAVLDPKYAHDFAGLSRQEITALGLDTPAGITGYRAYVKTVDSLNKAKTPEDILQNIFDGSMDMQGINNLTHQNAAMKAFGMPGLSDADMQMIDSDGDGNPDTPDQIRNNFINQNGGLGADGQTPMTVKEMLARGMKASSFRDGSTRATSLKSTMEQTASGNKLFKEYGQKYWADGTFNPTEAGQVAGTIDLQNWKDIQDLSNTAPMGEVSKYVLARGIDTFAQDTAQKAVNTGGGFKDRGDWDGALIQAWDGKMDDGNTGRMSASLSSLQKEIDTNPMYKQEPFAQHARWRMEQMSLALVVDQKVKIADAIASGNADDVEREVGKTKNLARILKYGSGSGAVPLAYNKLSGFLENNVGIKLPGEAGAAELDRKIDDWTGKIASVGQDFFKDPKRMGMAVATFGGSELVRAAQDIIKNNVPGAQTYESRRSAPSPEMKAKWEAEDRAKRNAKIKEEAKQK